MGVKLDAEHIIWPWLVEAVGWTMTRMEVGKDGKTAYERCRGKEARIPGVDFGEGVLWKRRREGGPLGKLTCMWEDGIYLGIKGSTGEIIVGNEKGVWRTRTTRRKTEGDRWDKENLKFIGGVPWRMSQEKGGDGEDLKAEVTIMDKDYRERIQKDEHEAVPRRMYIAKDDVEVHGYTQRCPGCVAILRGTANQSHSVGCRKRLEEAMRGRRRRKEQKGRWTNL